VNVTVQPANGRTQRFVRRHLIAYCMGLCLSPYDPEEPLTMPWSYDSFAAGPAAGRGWAHFSTRPEPIIHQMLARSLACAPIFRRWINGKIALKRLKEMKPTC
jgi:hypothetical protein